MHIPSATYRVQLNKEFTFSALADIIEYMNMLGVSTIYASPVFNATPGSLHGYDVTDPHSINPEIGSLEELKEMQTKLQTSNMTWLQDTVPNHMAFNTFNWRLMDVLERGEYSEYYNYFDINWHHPSPALKGKLMVPFLAGELDACLEKDEIKLSFSSQGFTIDYGGTKYPLSITAYKYLMLLDRIDNMYDAGDELHEMFVQGSAFLGYRDWAIQKRRWIDKLIDDKAKYQSISQLVLSVNKNKERLTHLLEHQHYVLTFWKTTEQEINYRRFFTINSLICLRMEDEAVFTEYHRMLYSFYNEKIIQGLRIDHVDGLYNPSQYIRRLRSLFGEECYIIAEKILEANEDVPQYWPLEGTSGYEFLSSVNQLFTNREGARALLRFYHELVPDVPSYSQLVFENKEMILRNYMAGEWENLVHYFFELNLQGKHSIERMKEAIGLMMLSMPVYRIYPRQIPLQGSNLRFMKETFDKALRVNPVYNEELLYLQSLTMTPPSDSGQHDRVLNFLNRLMQFTGPLTAKGVEDTTFYVYNPLISHDEVGDAPSTLGISIEDFHARMISRREVAPFSLNATATHDTKRGEDARMRLNVLSDFPAEWQLHVNEWFEMNRSIRSQLMGKPAPSINDEYFIYQSIVAGFPGDFTVTEEYISRLQEYLVKVVREAKVNSNWEQPDEAYEKACSQFVEQVLSSDHGFVNHFLPFMKKISGCANRYAIGQVLIKATAPGIPDTYQGCELPDLSYVDPDNRRAVNYKQRKSWLGKIRKAEQEGPENLLTFLRSHRNSGLEKLFVTWKALNFRRVNQSLFNDGAYIPVEVHGNKTSAIAFVRHFSGKWCLVAVPLGASDASDCYIALPEESPSRWTNIFTGEILIFNNRRLFLQDMLTIPVVFLEAER